MRSRYAWAAALALLAGCGKPTAPPSPAPAASKSGGNTVTLAEAAQRESGVEAVRVAERSLPQVLRASARLVNNENQTWRVGAVTEGRIVSIAANPGDSVKEGQVLARMHSHDIHESRAEYRRAVGELDRLRGAQAFSQRTRDRMKRLYELKAASLEQLDHAETEFRNATTAVSNGVIEVDRTRRHLTEFLQIPAEEPKNYQDNDEHRNEDLIPVRSPATGVVLTRKVTPGTVVTPSSDLFDVTDLSTLWAIVSVNEEHLSKLRNGMPVRLYVQAYGEEPFPGRIGKLGESLDPETRMIRVRVDVPNRGGRLKPEMYGEAEVEVGGTGAAVFVPQEAIQEVRGQPSVFVRVAPAKFEVRPVEAGRTLHGEVELRRGVRPGEDVVVRGSFILKTEFLKASLNEEGE